MIKAAHLLISTALLIFCISHAVAGDSLIIPGDRIDDFRLGEMTLENVKSRLGEPGRQGQTCMGIIVQYDNHGLRFYFDPATKKLKRIRTLKRGFHTESGIGPGSEISTARSEFNGTEISGKDIFDCENDGITFYYDKNTNLIISISINS